MKTFKSINPYDQSIVRETVLHTEQEIEFLLEAAHKTYNNWKSTSFEHRGNRLNTLAAQLQASKEQLAASITEEMGKPITQSLSEIEKCAWLCEYYAENGASILADRNITTSASESFVRYTPMGVILGIMPWNYPFWQVFRFAVPALFAGNAVVVKHAPNVLGCSNAIEKLLVAAGFPEGLFSNLICEVDVVPQLISDKRIKGVSLTGSTQAGQSVGALSGKAIKPSVLELGGSNAFIVTEDADIEEAVECAWMGRMQNTGQSCIAVKRILLCEPIAGAFINRFKEKLQGHAVSDPTDNNTFFGPMARIDLAEQLKQQLDDSVKKGAQLVAGGQQEKAHFQPALIVDVPTDSRAFQEETFGPLATIATARHFDEALKLANQSDYGLGATIFCDKDQVDQYRYAIDLLDDGAVFFNNFVKSDPRLPFGGTGISGYGRELSVEGLRSFVNTKTVYVK